MRMSDWSSDVCSSDLPGAALLAALGAVEIVEEDALLGEGQPRLRAFGFQLNGGQRHRDARGIEIHLVGIDDALVRNDVVVVRVEDVLLAHGRAAAVVFSAADPALEFACRTHTAHGHPEPFTSGTLTG